ncbi:unnamed protein product [Camellia sinensis]
MVVIEPEIMSKSEVDSPLQFDQQPKNHAFPSLGRQSSIYSLTLDEFQHTLCESGKNFGSMNMDEFLNSIWTAEENQAQAQTNSNPTTTTTVTATNISSNNNMQYFPSEGSTDRRIARQLSLSRQGSLTLPPPLCGKTVDEVWLEIHQSQQEQPQSGGGTVSSNVQNPGSTPWQPTFGEMTLEDFLVRAGVVREQCNPILPAQHQQQPCRLYQNNNNPGVGPSFVQRSIMALGIGGGGGGDNSGVNMPTYQALPQGGVGGVGEPAAYAGNGKRSGGGYPPPPSTVCYGSGRVGNVGGGGGSGGGYGQGQGQVLGMELPLSPVSSDGMCPSQGDGRNQFGMDMGGMRGGRKRIIDGPVEKVVERRQRRMIKNRESAARSRARKQAYTVELEAELNQLKEENAQLKQTLAELERKRKQQMWCNLMMLFHLEYFEEAKMKAQTKAQKAKEKMQVMRRTSSCPL